MEIILSKKEILKIIQDHRYKFKLGYTTLEVEDIRMTKNGCVLCIREIDDES